MEGWYACSRSEISEEGYALSLISRAHAKGAPIATEETGGRIENHKICKPPAQMKRSTPLLSQSGLFLPGLHHSIQTDGPPAHLLRFLPKEGGQTLPGKS